MLWLLLVQAMLCDGEEEIFPDDPRLAYIGRFATSPGFFLSSTPGNECPEGFSKVTEKGDCQAAAAWASDPKFWLLFDTESAKNWPHGCYFCEDVGDCSDGTWFNSHPGGSDHGGARPYCKGGDAPADATRYYAWPGSQIEARFSGTRVSANLTGSRTGDRFLAVLDGEPREPFVVAKHKEGWKQYTLAEGLSPGGHTLGLWKITEDLWQKNGGFQGACRFGGLSVDGQFLDPPAPRERRLEFIGDSDTAGYCADGLPSGGAPERKVDDTYNTWAAQLARRLNADFVALAISGYGVEEPQSVPDKLSRILPFHSSSVGAGTAWNFSDYVPDAVVMLIGPNDYPMNEKFKSYYIKMMNKIVSNYANASTPPALISVIAGSSNGFQPSDYIRQATAEFNAGRGDGFEAHVTSITTNTWKEINGCKINGRKEINLKNCHGASHYNGCNSHYNEKGHARVADEILPQVEKIMGWEGLSRLLTNTHHHHPPAGLNAGVVVAGVVVAIILVAVAAVCVYRKIQVAPQGEESQPLAQ